ncbi:MAG: hypothetical protein EOO44_21635 [Flavobacterium sp.]|nr:MAG: hypothetical protein EOO44_21635 [Flavobacterium sp.]
MIYFQTFTLEKGVDKQQFEKAIRKFSSKRTDFLDFKSSTSDFGLSKYFLGYEGKNNLQFTRIRTSFERVLPKLIFNLPKSDECNYYEVRLSFTATVLLCLLVFLFIVCTFSAFSKNQNYGVIPTILAVLSLYSLLIFFEIKFTKSRIKKAINNLT